MPLLPLTSHLSLLPSVSRFSCWGPKLISQIGHLEGTLADRCIIIRMQRKTSVETCERLRNLDAEPFKRRCARFVLDHQDAIATARPELPAGLSDRAAEIWEPLLILADLAGGEWPAKAREAAIGLSAAAQEINPTGALLLDIFVLFAMNKEGRMFTKTLVEGLVTRFSGRPWTSLFRCRPKDLNGHLLAHQLKPYGIKSRNMWIGDQQGKGYELEDFLDAFRRYVPKAEVEALIAGPKAETAKAA